MDRIDEAWARIVAYEGETLMLITGKEYTYSVIGDVLRAKGVNRNLPRSTFEKALGIMPVSGRRFLAEDHLRRELAHDRLSASGGVERRAERFYRVRQNSDLMPFHAADTARCEDVGSPAFRGLAGSPRTRGGMVHHGNG